MPLKSRGSVSARLRVWFSLRSRAPNAARSTSSGSSPPRSNAASASAPADQVEGRAPLAARLGEHQLPVGELEGGERDLPRRLGAGGEPAEPAGDHQVDDQEELAVEARARSACRAAGAR